MFKWVIKLDMFSKTWHITCLIKEYVAWEGWNIHFWRTTDKAEVDFVINKKNKVLPVEVKFGKISSPTVSRSFRSFLNK